MSALYTDPQKLQERLSGSKTGNIFQDSFTDYISDGLSLGPDGKVKREGAAWWLQGLTPGAEDIAKAKDAIQNNDLIRVAVKGAQVDEGAILKAANGAKITPDNIGGFIKKATLDYQTPGQIATQKNQEGQLQIAQQQQAAQVEAQRASNKLAQQAQALQQQSQRFQEQQAAENNKNRWQDKKDAREERLLTRQLNAQTSADNLQLQYAQLASQERRYAKDRKDQAILRIVEGLGNLGAAFTI